MGDYSLREQKERHLTQDYEKRFVDTARVPRDWKTCSFCKGLSFFFLMKPERLISKTIWLTNYSLHLHMQLQILVVYMGFSPGVIVFKAFSLNLFCRTKYIQLFLTYTYIIGLFVCFVFTGSYVEISLFISPIYRLSYLYLVVFDWSFIFLSEIVLAWLWWFVA